MVWDLGRDPVVTLNFNSGDRELPEWVYQSLRRIQRNELVSDNQNIIINDGTTHSRNDNADACDKYYCLP